MTAPAPKKQRGFALLSPEKRREIAAMGGRGVPAERRAFHKHREMAVEAGRKGGLSVDPKARSFFRNRELAVEAGRKGGKASRKVEAS